MVAAHLDRIERIDPRVNAIVTARRRARRRRGRGRRRGPGPRRERRTAPRAAAGRQGPPPDGRHPHHLRLAAVRRLRAAGRLLLVARSGPRAPSWSARPTCPSSGPAARRSTRSSAPPATPTTSPGPAAGSSGGARRRAGRRDGRRWPTAATWAGRSATRPASATSSGCGRHRGGCPRGRRQLAWQTVGRRGPDGPHRGRRRPAAERRRRTRQPLPDQPRRGRRSASANRSAATSWARRSPGPRWACPTSRPSATSSTPPARTFEALGCIVEDAEPDLTDADDIFHTWRALIMEAQLGTVAADPERRHLLKDTLRWNVERAGHLTGPHLAEVELARTGLYQRMHAFMTELRRARAAGQPGAALRRDDRVGDRDRRGADGHLHRLDALVLVDLRHRAARHLRARRLQRERPAGGRADRRAPIRASGTSSRSPTPSRRPPGSATGARPSRTTDRVAHCGPHAARGTDMRVVVLGAGSWGTTVAALAAGRHPTAAVGTQRGGRRRDQRPAHQRRLPARLHPARLA